MSPVRFSRPLSARVNDCVLVHSDDKVELHTRANILDLAKNLLSRNSNNAVFDYNAAL